MDTLQIPKTKIYWISFLSSLLISALVIWQDESINSDGYIYLRTAQLFLDGEWHAAVRSFNWPFFSALIAFTSGLTKLPLVYSAFLLNSLFIATAVTAFLKIVTELTTDRRVLIVAAILILSHPKLNASYRTYIIRDAGYWAFYLLAVLAYLRFWKYQRLHDAIAWGCAIIMAILFRIEGTAFLFAAPFLVFLKQNMSLKEKAQRFVQINLVPLLLCGLALAWLSATGHLELLNAGRISEPFDYLMNTIPHLRDSILDRADRLRDAVFYDDTYSHRYAVISTIGIVIIIFFAKVFGTLTYLYTPFSFHSIARRTFPSKTGASVIAGFLGINTFVLLVWLSDRFFLSGRYVLTLMFLLLIFAAFSLVQLYDRWQIEKQNSRRWRITGRVIVALFIITTLDGFISISPSNAYIREAGYWLKDNSPATAVIYSNIPKEILFYAGRLREPPNKRKISAEDTPNKLSSATKQVYIALRIRRKDTELMRWLDDLKGSSPEVTFANSKGDKVVIFSSKPNHSAEH